MSEPVQCDVCKGDGWRFADIPEDRCGACLGTGWAKTELDRAKHEMEQAQRDLEIAEDCGRRALRRHADAVRRLQAVKAKDGQ